MGIDVHKNFGDTNKMGRDCHQLTGSWYGDHPENKTMGEDAHRAYLMEQKHRVDAFFEKIGDIWGYQLEEGKIEKHAHFQYTIRTKDKKPIEEWNKLFREALPGAIDVQPVRWWNKAFNYPHKLEGRLNGPWGNYESSSETEYKGEDLPKEWKHFQQFIINECINRINDREILWFYDACAGHGKTKIAKFLATKHKALLLDWAAKGDIAYAVSKRKPEERKIIVFNLARAKPAKMCMQDLYSALEGCVDGFLFSPKYESQSVMWEGSRVVVFSNQKPNMEQLSEDRWCIIDISDAPQLIQKSSLKRKREAQTDFFEAMNKDIQNSNMAS